MIKKIITFFIVILSGCTTVPSKEGTAINKIYDSLTPEEYKTTDLPQDIKDAMIHELDFTSLKNTEDSQKTFDVVADKIPIRSFFLGLVEGTPYNVIVHTDVQGTISLQLKDVTLFDVLETLRDVYGYVYEINNNIIQVLPNKLITKTFKIDYLDINRGGKSETSISSSGLNETSSSSSSSDSSAESESESESSSSSSSSNDSLNSKITTNSKSNFWSELKASLETIIGNKDGRSIAITPMSGLIVVTAYPNELNKVSTFLKNAENSLNRQVILDAKILEVELNDAYRSGINWGAITGRMQANQIGANGVGSEDFLANAPNSVAAVGSKNSYLDIPPSKKLFTNNSSEVASMFGGVFTLAMNAKKLSTFIELLGSQGNVQVLSSPRISTTNNQKALIKVGTDEFFVTSINSSTTTSGGTTTTSPSIDFETFFSGIALDVIPQISSDGEIILHVHPTISTVQEQTKTVTVTTNGTPLEQNFPLAVSSIRESDSIVRATDGEVVVIGGLMQEKTSEVIVGVPILKDIPFLGNAFRHTKQQSKKSELVILIRPMIVQHKSWNKELSKIKSRFKELDRGFHAGGNSEIFGNLGEREL